MGRVNKYLFWLRTQKVAAWPGETLVEFACLQLDLAITGQKDPLEAIAGPEVKDGPTPKVD
jgi:hypothetical protein